MSRIHLEKHGSHRIGWLRAAVLGANDGLVSTASLIVGVAASMASTQSVVVAGTAGLVAGALSMAAGEYVSVSSQSDTEQADLAKERKELIEQPEYELNELAQAFVARGASKKTSLEIAEQLTAYDALSAHAREELGITIFTSARPLQAAATSALTFSIGAILPLGIVFRTPSDKLIYVVVGATLIFLSILGALGAITGGANIFKGIVRVTFWGAVALAITALVGRMFGAVV